jgi:cysteine-S-conjugate beta-lyase
MASGYAKPRLTMNAPATLDFSTWDSLTERDLRARRSAKWTAYAEDVLPAWIAEMDFSVAKPVLEEVQRAVAIGDFGYAQPAPLTEAFCEWIRQLHGTHIEPSAVRVAPDVVTAIAEILRVYGKRGSGCVIDTPVYAPFAKLIGEQGYNAVRVPVQNRSLDLARIEDAYRQGATAHILCSPHNPVGMRYPDQALATLGAIAERYGVLLISDEIHAPMMRPSISHTPLPFVNRVTEGQSIVVTSASKTWNLAGLRAAVVWAKGGVAARVLRGLPTDFGYHAGHLGVLASAAAFRFGEPWRKELCEVLARNTVIVEGWAKTLPSLRLTPPDAGYLLWLDGRELEARLQRTKGGQSLGDFLLREAKVACSPGPTFGPEGAGFFRLNIATPKPILEAILTRIGSAIASVATD